MRKTSPQLTLSAVVCALAMAVLALNAPAIGEASTTGTAPFAPIAGIEAPSLPALPALLAR